MRLTELGASGDLMISDEAMRLAALLAMAPDVEQVAATLQAANAKLRYVITAEECDRTSKRSTPAAAEELAFRTGAKLYKVGDDEPIALRALTLKLGDVIEFGSVRLQIESGAGGDLTIAVYDLRASDRSPIAVWPTTSPRDAS